MESRNAGTLTLRILEMVFSSPGAEEVKTAGIPRGSSWRTAKVKECKKRQQLFVRTKKIMWSSSGWSYPPGRSLSKIFRIEIRWFSRWFNINYHHDHVVRREKWYFWNGRWHDPAGSLLLLCCFVNWKSFNNNKISALKIRKEEKRKSNISRVPWTGKFFESREGSWHSFFISLPRSSHFPKCRLVSRSGSWLSNSSCSSFVHPLELHHGLLLLHLLLLLLLLLHLLLLWYHFFIFLLPPKVLIIKAIWSEQWFVR